MKRQLLLLLCCGSIWLLAAKTSQDSLNNRLCTSDETVTFAESVTSEQVKHLAILCKVWGVVKYQHPSVTTESINMDNELIKLIPLIENAKNMEESNNILLNWVNGFGEITKFASSSYPSVENIKLEADYTWMDKDLLGNVLVNQLENIKKAERLKAQRYIDFSATDNPKFKSELAYKEMKYPDKNYRLLSLFRYWNMIQYYFPNRHLIDDNWHDVLNEFIFKFICAKDEYEYKYSVLALWAKIKDTHAMVVSNDKVFSDILGQGNFFAPLNVKFVENKAVVVSYMDQELGQQTGLLPGDIIEKINGVSVSNIINEKLPVIPASNYVTQLRNIANYMLTSNDSEMELQYSRNGVDKKAMIKTYAYNKFSKTPVQSVQTIDSDIAYIYPGTIVAGDFSSDKMKEVLKSRGMIIDLRCYPNTFMVYNFSKYLMPEPTQFVKFSQTGYSYPGLFTYIENIPVGELNPDYFKGKVVIIVNEETQSQAEFTTMAFRVAPNATVIGSTTAGADGNVSLICLPGDLRTYISGIGVYYPDGTETQRVGIVPDVEIKPTIEGVRNGIDEPLQKAIEIINNESSISNYRPDSSVSLYPSIVTDGFHLDVTGNAASVTVLDMQGVVVFMNHVLATNNYVNIEFLSRGVYLVKIEFDDRVVQKKIIKK